MTLTSLQVQPTLTVRAFNRLLRDTSWDAIDLRAEAMRKRGMLSTGLSDFGGDGFDERLEAVCRALHWNKNLSPFGRFAAALFFHFHIENHLRVVKRLNERPYLRERRPKAPIFIVGFYRTGTTLMHNLLGADERHTFATGWELMTPVPFSENPRLDGALRRLRARAIFDTAAFVAPDVKVAHVVELEGPEEEFFLMENDFLSTTLINSYEGHDYGVETLSWDMAPVYRSLREQLNIITEGRSDRRLILKTPYHLWHLPALIKEFPDARFVFTHRSAHEALASYSSLSAMTTSKFVRDMDLHALGRFWFNFYKEGAERAMSTKHLIPAAQRIDVPLPALAKDPIGTVEAIYRYFGLDFDAKAELPIREKLASGAGRSQGKHNYHLEQFGLDEEEVKHAFRAYDEFYQGLVESFPKTHGLAMPASAVR